MRRVEFRDELVNRETHYSPSLRPRAIAGASHSANRRCLSLIVETVRPPLPLDFEESTDEPITVPFFVFRIMVGCGVLMLGVVLISDAFSTALKQFKETDAYQVLYQRHYRWGLNQLT